MMVMVMVMVMRDLVMGNGHKIAEKKHRVQLRQLTAGMGGSGAFGGFWCSRRLRDWAKGGEEEEEEEIVVAMIRWSSSSSSSGGGGGGSSSSAWPSSLHHQLPLQPGTQPNRASARLSQAYTLQNCNDESYRQSVCLSVLQATHIT
jgi:hypothetical protein